MSGLEGPIRAVEIIVGAAVAMMLGDYFGYKLGRWRLAMVVGIIALVSIIAFWLLAVFVIG